jgi:hypothetical protein
MAEQSWLDWAVSVEDEAGCDVEAGPDVGQLLVEYINQLEGSVTYKRLLEFLKEELGSVLPVEEIETIAGSTLKDVSKRVKEKRASIKTAL